MKWTDEMCATLIQMHAEGRTDTQIAKRLGTSRNAIASYRNTVLGLKVNSRFEKTIPCPACSIMFASQRNMRRHARREHDAVFLPRQIKKGRIGEPRRLRAIPVPGVPQLRSRGGNFDSARALSFLVDHWRKAA